MEAPVAIEVVENDTSSTEPEVVQTEDTVIEEAAEESEAPQEEVSNAEESEQEVIDFLAFAEANPNLKIKFKKNGEDFEIDAKKAAAILGQGGAIHEEARKLKVAKAEFEEFEQEKRNQLNDLTLAMEFTVVPQLQQVYDSIAEAQQYNRDFAQMLSETNDPAVRAEIEQNIATNETFIKQQYGVVGQIKPKVEYFYQERSKTVSNIIENTRKNYQDKELRNPYVFNELREKLTKEWGGAKAQSIPGVANIDLICSDEQLLGLVRDGLKYREKPQVKPTGLSNAALTNAKKAGGIANTKSAGEAKISQLQEQAKKGDKKAADAVIASKLMAFKSQRNGR
jgi:hypothetical protein